MSQILSQVPRQLLQQQQRLTPQLIQAMDILQLNALALESRIQQEIDGNPALELVADEEIAAPTPPAPAEPSGDAAPATADGAAQEFERLDELVNEYDWLQDEYSEHRGARSREAVGQDGDAKLEAMNNTAARPPSLQEHLLEQWRLVEVDEETRRLGTLIIEALDEHGRLPVPLEKLGEAIEPRPAPEALEDALMCVQELDPPGIAARDLQECLLLQLDALPGAHRLARRIVVEHFEDLQKNRLPLIAKELGVEMDEVKDALEVLGRLSLHPGLDVTSDAAPPVVPDVLVEYDEERDVYEVRLSRGNQRELRISDEFRDLIEQYRDDKKAREFVKQKLEAAAALIDAVKFRSDRLLEVSKAVFEAQRDFLDHGEQHIRVFRMSEVAQRFNCDPSTISRTVDGKWVQTPRGIYPLRRFFTGGTESHDGEALSWDAIRAKVQEIIDNEDKKNPLSDDEIVERLQSQGIEIKRRTVAKYRAVLGVPTARQRRQY